MVVKRGAKVPRGPLLAGGYARIFIPRDASCRHGTRFSQRACRGPPHALGATKERNMVDEEGGACPMPDAQDFLALAKALKRIAATM